MLRPSLALLLLKLSTFVFSRTTTRSVGALYAITNDPRGNSVLINSIGEDGKLTFAGAVPTGGTGTHGVFPGMPVAADALFSQGSVVVDGNYLFVVNAESNTISMFAIDPSNPLKIKRVGEPVDSGGEFPVSVAVESKAGLVCVLNGGRINGVLCYTINSYNSHISLSPQSKFHSFNLNNTTPPVGPPGTVTQVLFSEDGKKLRVSVKGIASTVPGAPLLREPFVASWDVRKDGTLSDTYEKFVPPMGEGLRPFGMVNLPSSFSGKGKDGLFVTDAGLGIVVYEFSPSHNGNGTTRATFHPLNIENQVATCWVAYSDVTNSFWNTDVGNRKIYEVSVSEGTLRPKLEKTIILAEGEDPIDVVIASILGREYLYVLSPLSSSFEVFALKKVNGKGDAELIQTLKFGKEVKIETPMNTIGAAVYLI